MQDHARPPRGWLPSPRPDFNSLERTGYLAGYSDGFHGFDYGAGYDDPPKTYGDGFDDGRMDAGRALEPRHGR